jgi:hypothetical protein
VTLPIFDRQLWKAVDHQGLIPFPQDMPGRGEAEVIALGLENPVAVGASPR